MAKNNSTITVVDLQSILSLIASRNDGEPSEERLILEENSSEGKFSPTENIDEAPSAFGKEVFIEAVRQYKCLWDTNDRNYKNRSMKINAWNDLSSLFNKDGK